MAASDVHNGRIWAVVPVYNNGATVRAVAEGCRKALPHVLVVDDGSTDTDVAALLTGLDVAVLRHDRNRGKGAAILTASRHVEQRGGRYLITIDADGQHDPADIGRFLPLLAGDDAKLVVGIRDFDTQNVPRSSRFGRSFANFWLRVETGIHISDCQSGFRAYPARELNLLRFRRSRYDFEAEVLARAAWAGIPLVEVPVTVRYPRPEERVSSFKPLLDNLRLAHTHALLVGRRLLPFPHKRLAGGDAKRTDWALLLDPRRFFRELLAQQATPGELAAAASVGTFIAALPMPFHTGAIFYVATRLRLNLLMALNIQHLCMPPFVPALCIEIGHYLRFGKWFTDLSFQAVFAQFSDRLFEWFLGSLVVAPLASVVVGSAVHFIAVRLRKGRGKAWLERKTRPSAEGTG